MTDTVLIAILSTVGTIMGSLLGILAANKMTNFRLEKLEEKVNKHNNVIERMSIAEIRIKEPRSDIDKLESRR